MMNTVTLKQLSEDKEQTREKLIDYEKQVEILKLDKVYLSKEIEQLKLQRHTYEQEKDTRERRIMELKKTKQDLFEKL